MSLNLTKSTQTCQEKSKKTFKSKYIDKKNSPKISLGLANGLPRVILGAMYNPYNELKNYTTYNKKQVESEKRLYLKQKVYKSIAIPIILHGVCYKTHTTIAEECGTYRQNICEFTTDDQNIVKINRGVKKSCLHSVPKEYTTFEGLTNSNQDDLKKELLPIYLSNLLTTEILLQTTSNLGIKASSFFAKFSDIALNDSYVNMITVSNGVLEYFDNIAGYFYTSCMKYHKEYDIPLLY